MLISFGYISYVYVNNSQLKHQGSRRRNRMVHCNSVKLLSMGEGETLKLWINNAMDKQHYTYKKYYPQYLKVLNSYSHFISICFSQVRCIQVWRRFVLYRFGKTLQLFQSQLGKVDSVALATAKKHTAIIAGVGVVTGLVNIDVSFDRIHGFSRHFFCCDLWGTTSSKWAASSSKWATPSSSTVARTEWTEWSLSVFWFVAPALMITATEIKPAMTVRIATVRSVAALKPFLVTAIAPAKGEPSGTVPRFCFVAPASAAIAAEMMLARPEATTATVTARPVTALKSFPVTVVAPAEATPSTSSPWPPFFRVEFATPSPLSKFFPFTSLELLTVLTWSFALLTIASMAIWTLPVKLLAVTTLSITLLTFASTAIWMLTVDLLTVSAARSVELTIT